MGANSLTLGQVAVDDQSNEITAIPKLLRVLHVEGALVSVDAIGCQKEVARAVRDAGADYLLQVKGNQPKLQADVIATIDAALEADFAGVGHELWMSASSGHGWEEERYAVVLYGLDGLSTREEWGTCGPSCRSAGSCAGAARRGGRRRTTSVVGAAARSHWRSITGCTGCST